MDDCRHSLDMQPGSVGLPPGEKGSYLNVECNQPQKEVASLCFESAPFYCKVTFCSHLLTHH